MATVWSAIVPLPAHVPLEQVHVMLYSYFPDHPPGAPRPYVWRLIDKGHIGIVSSTRPTAMSAQAHDLPAGVTLDFKLTFKRERTVGGSYTRADGTRRQRERKIVTIGKMAELRQWLIAFAAGRGVGIGYVRLDSMRDLRIERRERTICLPIVDAAGQMLITDPDLCAGLLAGGGPGTGKAYGCGCWWLPSLFEARRIAA